MPPRRPPLQMKPLLPTEHAEQVRLFQEAAIRGRQRPEWNALFAIPNAGGYTGGYKQNVARVLSMKSEGVKPGIPDLFLPVPRGAYHGCFVEMKRQREGSLSEDQRLWLQALSALGYRAVMCRGCDEALREIEAYLSLGEGGKL